jgi:hypothetical protein
MRHFHSYGPIDSQEHFCVQRQALITQGVEQLIGKPEKGGHYFTIWAPRQTGKTWLMRQLELNINQQYPDKFSILKFSLDTLRGMSFTPSENSIFPEAFGELIQESFSSEPVVKTWKQFGQLFSKKNGVWDRPVILLIDEVDTIPLSLIDLMVAQFREMYLARENNWLHGLALVGVRAVLGIESKRGSPFNVQRSLKVPNLTSDEVTELYRQYQDESGQKIEVAVVEKVYESTQGQPGLVSWFGELLTETYNPDTKQVIDMEAWKIVWQNARFVEPNNTVMNLIAKARDPEYQHFLIKLFGNNNIPFSFHRPVCNYLYLHGIIEHFSITYPEFGKICCFSSPFIQDCLYYALTDEIIGDETSILPLQPLDDLADVFGGSFLNIPALLMRYKDYLAQLKEQPRRKTDLHLIEAVGHFHLFSWLREAIGRRCVVSPEFPAGSRQVDLHLRCDTQLGIIEVKSFVDNYQIKSYREQAADYGKSLGLDRVTVALFIPVLDENVLETLSTIEVVYGVEVTVVAIGWQ